MRCRSTLASPHRRLLPLQWPDRQHPRLPKLQSLRSSRKTAVRSKTTSSGLKAAQQNQNLPRGFFYVCASPNHPSTFHTMARLPQGSGRSCHLGRIEAQLVGLGKLSGTSSIREHRREKNHQRWKSSAASLTKNTCTTDS